MSAKKRLNFYAVKVGLKPGIYNTWEECCPHVERYPRAEYKGFATLGEAKEYLGDLAPREPLSFEIILPDTPPIPTFLSTPAQKASARKQVTIYSDGACVGNPGPGGYGAIIIYGEHRKELSAGFRLTTNNRMEILGCMVALAALREPCDVTVYSDSKYVVNTMSKSWALKWRKKGWQRTDANGENRPVLNQDLWTQMLDLCEKHKVCFKWVRGHDGNVENERCDKLARSAAASHPLGIDSIYEQPVVASHREA